MAVVRADSLNNLNWGSSSNKRSSKKIMQLRFEVTDFYKKKKKKNGTDAVESKIFVTLKTKR